MPETVIAARLLAAMEQLGDETPLMQVTESEEAWGGTEVGTQESGLTVGDLRALCRAVADEEADTSDGRIIVSYDRWRALQRDSQLVQWCVANPSIVPHQWGRNHRHDPLWIFGDRPEPSPIPGTWRDAVAARATPTGADHAE